MKKQALILLSLVLVLLSVVGVSPVFADHSADDSSEVTVKEGAKASAPGEMTIQETTSVKVEYDLPYPGILPDHPLYFLKTLRDNILQMLIVDPIRKIEFFVLQADKKVMMGSLLLEKGKNDMGADFVSKAELSFQDAVESMTKLKAQGKDVPGYIVEKVEKAMAKHIEVLGALVAKAGDAQKKILTESITLLEKLQKDLAKIK